MSRNIIAIKLGMEIGEEAVICEATQLRADDAAFRRALDPHRLRGRAARWKSSRPTPPSPIMGERASPLGILRVEDRQGNILWQPAGRGSKSVMDPPHALDHERRPAGRGPARHRPVGVGRLADSISRPAGRPARPTTATTSGSSASPPTSSRACGSGSTSPEDQGQRAGRGLAAPAWTAMMREVYERRRHPARVAAAGWPHRSRHRQDHRLQGDAILPEGRPLHRVVHSRDGADGLLSNSLAVRRGRRGDRSDGWDRS